MKGIFLITHGSLGESLIQCTCHVLNKRPEQLAQLGVTCQDDPVDVLPLARGLLKLVDSGEGVLLLTDMFGATPSNIAHSLLEPGRIEGIAGASLPMLLRALTYRGEAMATLLAKTAEGGREGVLLMKAGDDAQR